MQIFINKDELMQSFADKLDISPHLGGHSNKTWTDPQLLGFLSERLKLKSFLDIGCGPGGMVQLALNMGLRARGIDGDTSINYSQLGVYIDINDYNLDSWIPLEDYDLGWSVEFLEHVDQQYLPNVFETLKYCKYIICTASTMKNRFHKNVQPQEYWIQKFMSNGFEFDKELTTLCKLNTGMAINTYLKPLNFIQATGMFYVNRNSW